MEKSRAALVHRDVIPGRPGEYDEESLRVVYGMLKEAVDAVGGMKSVIRKGDKVVGCASTSMHRTFFPGKSSAEVLENYRQVQPAGFDLEGYPLSD
jgi:hypothetical protein